MVVDAAGESAAYLLAPAAGGLTVTHGGREVTLLTPSSTLYRKLLGVRVGDLLEDSPLVVANIT